MSDNSFSKILSLLAFAISLVSLIFSGFNTYFESNRFNSEKPLVTANMTVSNVLLPADDIGVNQFIVLFIRIDNPSNTPISITDATLYVNAPNQKIAYHTTENYPSDVKDNYAISGSIQKPINFPTFLNPGESKQGYIVYFVNGLLLANDTEPTIMLIKTTKGTFVSQLPLRKDKSK